MARVCQAVLMICSRFRDELPGMRALLPVLLVLPTAAALQPSPSASPAPAPLRVAVLSDFNGAYGATMYPAALGRVMNRVLNVWRPDAVLSAGDLIAGQKASLTDAQVRAMWAAFDRNVGAPLSNARIPFGFTLGNHDAGLARDRREAAAYWNAHTPALKFVDRAAFPFRFSFTLGGGRVFVVSLDAAGPQVDAAQRAWLARELARPEARGAGLRLVLGHLPLAGVSTGKNRPGEVIREADALRGVMERGGVNLYVHGHHAAFYPARLGGSAVSGAGTGAGLNVLSSGGIGGRDYLGFPGTARSTVTLLTLWPEQGRVTFQTYDADTGQEMKTAALPPRIDGLGGPLVRVSEFR